MKGANLQQPARPGNKEPWLAVNLSLLFPGIGQIYAGKSAKGIVLIGCETMAIAIAVWSIFSPIGNTVTGIRFLLLAIGIYIFNIFDAYKSVPKSPRLISKKPSPPTISNYSSFALHRSSDSKNPWLSVFFSQILPGLGHLYLEKFLLGGSLLVGTIICANLANLLTPLIIIQPILYAIASYHAYFIAPKQPNHSKHQISAIVAIILALKLTITFLPILINQKIELFTIPSSSMWPTLKIGDRIFVKKSSNYLPQIGEIIVFQVPKIAQSQDLSENTFFVKRVLGKPGQIIQVKNGVVYLNKQPLQENYLIEDPAYEWGPETVPTDAYLVLGDNRNDSFDSHVWGFLPAANIVGKAYKIYWPPARIRPLN